MSPRTEETNARIREEQKERILEAAKAIFAHKGLLTVAKFIYLLYTILIFFGSLLSGWFLLK